MLSKRPGSCLSFVIFIVIGFPAHAVPSFTVSLDDEPEVRYNEILNFYREEMIALRAATKAILEQRFNESTRNTMANYVRVPEEQTRELTGIRNTLRGWGINTTHNEQVFQSMLYELASPTVSMGCSGSLVALKNGTVVQGRNMDYPMNATMPDGSVITLNNVTHNVLFTKEGRPIMTAVMWPGKVTFHTAMRFDGWSWQQNTRPGNDFELNYHALKRGQQPFGFIVREAFSNIDNFQDAVSYFQTVKFNAPQYFILAGSQDYEGVVLSIDRGGQSPASQPPEWLNREVGTWKLYQPNDDLRILHDGWDADLRRSAESAFTQNWDQSAVSSLDVLRLLHTPPILNGGTVFTWIAMPATGYYQTVLPDEPPYWFASPTNLAFVKSHGEPKRFGLAKRGNDRKVAFLGPP